MPERLSPVRRGISHARDRDHLRRCDRSAERGPARRPNRKLIYLESPGNPILALCDLAACVEFAREMHATTICDSTFATPINQRPLDLGMDVVVHSLTQYFCGHGDAVGGAIAGRSEFVKRCADEPLRYFGGILSSFNAYLILRGTQTLPLRVERHNANAFAIANFLQGHPQVGWVSYPGLESHPEHALAHSSVSRTGPRPQQFSPRAAVRTPSFDEHHRQAVVRCALRSRKILRSEMLPNSAVAIASRSIAKATASPYKLPPDRTLFSSSLSRKTSGLSVAALISSATILRA